MSKHQQRHPKDITPKSITPKNITQASAAVANLSNEATATLASGKSITVKRLSWIQFETMWLDIAAILAALMAADEHGEDPIAQLAGAPTVVLKLTGLCTGIAEPELARWHFADVLAVATVAINLNFIESAGVRDFFSALGNLSTDAVV